MRNVSKTLHFPMAGVGENLSYRDSTPPHEDDGAYASPFAENVRGKCSIEGRMRGGSRPGFGVVTGVYSTPEKSLWLWPNGEPIKWPDGKDISFRERIVRWMMPDGSRMADPHETFLVGASKGDAPSGASIMTFHRARAFLASGSSWYCSRTGDVGDWDYGADIGDVGRPVAGSCALADRQGEDITAFMPVDDAYLYVATSHSLWLMSGEPTSGTFSCVADFVGCVGANAWCWSGRHLLFLSCDGVYALAPGEHPVCVSERVPEEFKAIKASDDPLMVFDPAENGVHIFSAKGNWFYDIGSKSLWPVKIPATVQPVCGMHAMVSGVYSTVFKCLDGSWRTFSDADTSETVASKVAIGPIHVSGSDAADGIVDEVYVTTGVGSASVGMRVAVGHSAEEAVRNARAGTFASPEFVFTSGWNPITRPRARGAWCVLVLSSSGKWAFESIKILCKQLGRLR